MNTEVLFGLSYVRNGFGRSYTVDFYDLVWGYYWLFLDPRLAPLPNESSKM